VLGETLASRPIQQPAWCSPTRSHQGEAAVTGSEPVDRPGPAHSEKLDACSAHGHSQRGGAVASS
jgi:hypothetical protein